MALNEAIPFYEDGATITATAAEAVSGKTFARISATRPYGPGFSLTGTDTTGGNVVVATAEPGQRKFGVFAFDQPVVGGKVSVLRAPGIVVPVVANLAIIAFEEVSVGATGQVVPWSAATNLPASKAKLLTGVIVSNNAITFTAKQAGDFGNDINIVCLLGPSQALAVTTVENVITIKPKTSAGSVSESIAAQIIAAIEAEPAANALVTATNTGASTGAGLYLAAAFNSNLGGGLPQLPAYKAGYALASCNPTEDAQIHLY